MTLKMPLNIKNTLPPCFVQSQKNWLVFVLGGRNYEMSGCEGVFYLPIGGKSEGVDSQGVDSQGVNRPKEGACAPMSH
jgi:hypothetical protein